MIASKATTMAGALIFAGVVTCTMLDLHPCQDKIREPGSEPAGQWIYAQRAYPAAYIEPFAQQRAIDLAASLRANHKRTAQPAWVFAGPVNIGGRITDLEGHTGLGDTLIMASASGGMFKLYDHPNGVMPIFDDVPVATIGDFAIHPQDPQTMYVGTGEANGASNSSAFPGNGMYKTTDGGKTWSFSGLPNAFQIGKVIIDPKRPERVFAAVMGLQYVPGQDRGVYRTIDGGASWQKMLFVNDTTGCIDLAINPDQPDTLYAAMWSRIRRVNSRYYAGEGSGVFRSTDGGVNWSRLSGGLPAPSADVGRIGISIAPSSPNVIYAAYATNTITNVFDAVYKSTDHGQNWNRVDQTDLSNAYSSFGWYFGKIMVDPADADHVFLIGFQLHESTDGGVNWNMISGGVHVDEHAVYIDPDNAGHYFLGGDGGLAETFDAGNNWMHHENLPITQFYICEIDHTEPTDLYGGTQDNNTIRTATGALNDWQALIGGDGFYVLVDPNNNQNIYAESQYGGLRVSYNGGNSFSNGTSGISGSDRKNWSTPICFDPNNTNTLYYGSQRVWRSTNQAGSWTAISNDLTNGPGTGNLTTGTLTTIDISPANSNVIYVGTQDGNVWVSPDGGNNWNAISSGLPNLWVTRVAVDPADASTCYITFSGYPLNDFTPHVFKTTDMGQNWQSISGNLPSFPVNDIIIDPDKDSILYIATDLGAYYTMDEGQSWQVLGAGMPNVPVFDIDLHNGTRKLVAATHGRGLYTLDLSLVTSVKPAGMSPAAAFKAMPNAFDRQTELSFYLPQAGSVQLDIYDMQGKFVKRLHAGSLAAGPHRFSWNGKNNYGDECTSGMYFARLITSGNRLALRLVRN